MTRTVTWSEHGSEKNQKFTELMKIIASNDEGDLFLGWPENWMQLETILWRCENGHVSTMSLRTDESGTPRDLCLACQGRVSLTDPSDYEGKTWEDKRTVQKP